MFSNQAPLDFTPEYTGQPTALEDGTYHTTTGSFLVVNKEVHTIFNTHDEAQLAFSFKEEIKL